jgi:hypothetical protein
MHYAAQTFHHDCIPAFVMDELTSEAYFEPAPGGGFTVSQLVPLPEEDLHPSTRRVLDIRKKAESGTRGPKLLNWINNQPPADEVYGDNSSTKEK